MSMATGHSDCSGLASPTNVGTRAKVHSTRQRILRETYLLYHARHELSVLQRYTAALSVHHNGQ